MNPNAKGTVHVVIKGATKPRIIKITEDRAEHDFTGVDIDIEWNAGIDPTVVADVEIEWANQAIGTVRVTGIGDLPIGDYGYRYMLTGGGEIEPAPNGRERDTFQVVGV